MSEPERAYTLEEREAVERALAYMPHGPHPARRYLAVTSPTGDSTATHCPPHVSGRTPTVRELERVEQGATVTLTKGGA